MAPLKRVLCVVFLSCWGGVLCGCVPMTGAPSMTLLTRDLQSDSASLSWVGEPVEESETFTWALVFLLWGQQPTHESVLSRVLEKHNADVLLDAELHSVLFGIPYLFMQMKTTASGRPARFGGGL